MDFGPPVAYPTYSFGKFWRHFNKTNFVNTLRSYLNFSNLLDLKDRYLYVKYNNLYWRWEEKTVLWIYLLISVFLVNYNQIWVNKLGFHFLFICVCWWSFRTSYTIPTINTFWISRLTSLKLLQKNNWSSRCVSKV